MTTTSEPPPAKGRRTPAPGAGVPARGAALTAALAAALLLLALPGCNEEPNALNDGFYTAQADSFGADGWRDFLTIYVNNGQIAIAEYDAVNLSGFRRSWDMDYHQSAMSTYGSKASQYYLSYQAALLSVQDAEGIQPIQGAQRMHQVFTALAMAAIDRSRANDNSIANVRLPENVFPGEL
jgi:major membrane immunogen (membrane-anchored lipoprotein)